MKTLLTHHQELEDRLAALTPADRPAWGIMSAPQMLAHLADACRLALGERPAKALSVPFRAIFKWLALRTPFRWSHNFPTVPEADQRSGGSPPITFNQDRATVLALLTRIAQGQNSPTHPYFGRMSATDWHIYAYRHTDHHLRQFGR